MIARARHGSGGVGWEHFPHGADIGIRGMGSTKAAAFIGAALAMTAAVTDPLGVADETAIAIQCQASDDEMLLVDWINALVLEMSSRGMVFGRFEVRIEGTSLTAVAHGETVDVRRHEPVVEVKGATLTELAVHETSEGNWIAQCVIDV